MGNLSIFHWLLFFIVIAPAWVLPIVLSARLLAAKGYNWNWAWFGLMPLGGIAVLLISLLLAPIQPRVERGQ